MLGVGVVILWILGWMFLLLEEIVGVMLDELVGIDGVGLV